MRRRRAVLPAGLCLAALLAAALTSPPGRAGPEPEPKVPWAADAASILDGVAEVAAPGAVPGSLAVFGDDAFPLLLGGAGGLSRVPIAAAARLDRGRLVVLAHGAFVTAGAAGTADTRRFLHQSIAWASRPRAGERASPRGRGAPGPAAAVAGLRLLVVGSDLAPALEAHGAVARAVERVAPLPPLHDVDAVVLGEGDLRDDAREALDRFVREGGGLVTGLCPWGWLAVSGATSLDANGIARLVAPAGLAFTKRTVEPTGRLGYLVAGPPGVPFHAARAVERLAATGGRRGGGFDLVVASTVAIDAVRALPADERRLRGRVRALAASRAGHLVPSEREPLRADRPLDRFLLAASVASDAERAPALVRASPAAAHFPGAVPAGAKPVERELVVELAVPGWHSTGLYAVPGRPVVLRRSGPGEGPRGLTLRIGCHTDTLWHLDAWPRVPELARAVAIEGDAEGRETVAASPYGGLVYVEVPEGASGRFACVLAGAVEAPRFVQGETDAAAWARARRAPAPWAELGTRKLVLTVPSDVVRGLEDPAPLLAFWDRVMDAAADLAAIPHARRRPERIVADVAISAGYMHAGYPIMTHLDAAPRMVDVAGLSRDGDWGLFHELGHNHQDPTWTFDGTVEVTCNLFTLYVMETVCGRPPTTGHDALVGREARARAHVEAGAPFAAWQQDPFLALTTYVHLLEGFGWAKLREVLAGYRTLSPDERPRSEEEKRDAWMVRYARAVGRDLGPFFTTWGVPTSAAARASIADLPPWMPPGLSPRRARDAPDPPSGGGGR